MRKKKKKAGWQGTGRLVRCSVLRLAGKLRARPLSNEEAAQGKGFDRLPRPGSGPTLRPPVKEMSVFASATAHTDKAFAGRARNSNSNSNNTSCDFLFLFFSFKSIQ
jgi:hypothetical protein